MGNDSILEFSKTHESCLLREVNNWTMYGTMVRYTRTVERYKITVWCVRLYDFRCSLIHLYGTYLRFAMYGVRIYCTFQRVNEML